MFAAILLLVFSFAWRRLTAGRRKWKRFTKIDLEAHRRYLDSIKPLTDGEKKNTPNVIVILMDDMGWGDISHFGSRSIKTPHIDKLAQSGITLTNSYASSPVCSPSRFSLLTGRYPHRGIINNVFFPTVKVEKKDTFDMGYEDDGVLTGKPKKTGGIKPWKLYRLILKALSTKGILPDEVTLAEGLKARGYKTGMFGKWHLGDQSPHLPNDKGFDYFFGAHYSNDMCPYHFYRNKEIAVEGVFDQSNITALLTDEITDFIDKNSNDPFFVYYPSPWPHHPLSAGEKFRGTSEGGIYGDCIQEVDWSVGEIVKKLEEKGISENTLILFTSDNGPWHQGSPGLHRGRKGNAFDGGQVVPTLAYWPGTILEGERTDEQVMNIDFLPTIFGMAGIDLPVDRVIDGKDILPLLKGEEQQSPHEELFYIHDMKAYGVRNREHFKYFASQKSENSTYKMIKIHPFLFNLKRDPNESYDLRAHYPEVTEKMQKTLFDYNREIETNPRGMIKQERKEYE